MFYSKAYRDSNNYHSLNSKKCNERLNFTAITAIHSCRMNINPLRKSKWINPFKFISKTSACLESTQNLKKQLLCVSNWTFILLMTISCASNFVTKISITFANGWTKTLAVRDFPTPNKVSHDDCIVNVTALIRNYINIETYNKCISIRL